MMKLNEFNFLEFIKNNKWIFLVFLIFLSFQIYQTNSFFWDPFVYQLNGKWFCGEQIYFEYLRPPLPSFVNCLVGANENSILFSQIISSFFYLIAALFLYNVESKNKKLDQLVFALLIFLAPQIFVFGNFGGDFFALSFLIIALLLKNPLYKGIIFGLSTLSRYNFFFYIILLIDYEKLDFKEILKLIVGIILPWIPWLIYNYSTTGNALFSIEETTHLNFLVKGIFSPVEIYQIILILFFLLVLNIGNLKNNLNDNKAKAGFIALAQFVFSGIKEARFLNVFVPFQATVISSFVTKNKKFKYFFVILMLMVFIWSFFTILNQGYSKEIPMDLIEMDCRVMSDNWVYLYKGGIIAEPLPSRENYFYFLEKGVNLIFYDNSFENIDFTGFEVKKTDDYFLVKSNTCSKMPNSYKLFVWRGNNPQN